MNVVFAPQRVSFTVEQVEKMAAAGVFAEGERVELIDGELLTMAAVGDLHDLAVARFNRMLNRHAIADRLFVYVQSSLKLSTRSYLLPDLSVFRARADDYAPGRPATRDAILVIEVAETSLRYDTTRKRDLYASYGVAEFWVLALPERALRVFRKLERGQYRETLTLEPGQRLAPLALPELELAWFEALA